MEDRKGDARIYLIYGLFLACTIGGGVFLYLYIVKSDSESTPWYAIAGMALVAIPWVLWFLIYLYRCFRPVDVQFGERQNHGKDTGTPKSALTTNATNPSGAKSLVGGERRVHFGEIVEMGHGFGDGGGGGQEQHHEDVLEKVQDHDSKEGKTIPSLVMVESRESELPLTFGGKS